ncbi:MAG: uroporphyrinogen decarboxylase family protein [Planctomycetota bacterium]|jgi:hypothetical protein
MTTSRERLLTVIEGGKADRIPLVCRMFGFPAPPGLGWEDNGKPVPFWYTMRLEHIHTLPYPWDVNQDFKRAEALLSLNIDDVLEVSSPWSIDERVTIRDYEEPDSAKGEPPVACREYTTPDGVLIHKVKRTNEEVGAGWVIQPDYPPLIEDYNIPRATRHVMVTADDLPKLRHLLCRPTNSQFAKYRERMKTIRRFADSKGLLVCGWSLFGMDGVVWLCGAEAAVVMAMQQPELFEQVIKLVDEFDRMRTDLMLEVGGVDLIVQRGWYSSVDFWSPKLFEQHILPNLKQNVAHVHGADVKFAYAMTTGVKPLLHYLVDANVDLYYWADPVQGDADLETIREKLGGKVAIAGGVNAPITLGMGTPKEIRQAVADAIEILGPSGFILEPMDSLFPNTPWEAVKTMIDAWKELTF